MGSLSSKTLGLEWPKFRTLTTPNAAEEMEQQELSSIASTGTDFGRQFMLSLKTKRLPQRIRTLGSHCYYLLILLIIINPDFSKK